MRNRPRLSCRRPGLQSEPDLSSAYKTAIEAALRWAWAGVHSLTPEILRNGTEEEITKCIQRALNEQDRKNARRRAPGLDGFETVNRGSKVTTADGRIEKAPDLVFRPVVSTGVRNLGDWGMFVECKIIAPEKHHSPEIYCAKGVARFVCGEYAPRMPRATMIAYVRDGRQPYSTLFPLLNAEYATTSHETAVPGETSISRHDRSSAPHPCVEITLTHLWFDAR
jgi:hypothetical protein